MQKIIQSTIHVRDINQIESVKKKTKYKDFKGRQPMAEKKL